MYRQSGHTMDESPVLLGPEDRTAARTTEGTATCPPSSLDFSAIFEPPMPFDDATFDPDLLLSTFIFDTEAAPAD